MPTLPIVDTFNRTDSPGALGTTSDGQCAWGTAGGHVSGTWDIDTNRALGRTDNGFITIDTGVAGGSGAPIRISVKLVGAVAEQGIAFRSTSSTSVCRAVLNGGTCYLQTNTGGGFSTVTTAAHAFVVGDTMSVLLDGANVSVERNGVAFIGPTTVSHNSTATAHGLAVAVGNATYYYDDFQIASAVTSSGATPAGTGVHVVRPPRRSPLETWSQSLRRTGPTVLMQAGQLGPSVTAGHPLGRAPIVIAGYDPALQARYPQPQRGGRRLPVMVPPWDNVTRGFTAPVGPVGTLALKSSGSHD